MRVRVLLLLAAALGGCSSAKDQCATSQDCADQGLTTQRCIDGKCQQPCTVDTDCTPPERMCMSGDAECERLKREEAESAPKNLICQAKLCAVGCPDTPCGAKEKCVDKRCAYLDESFEGMPPDVPTLERLGWNGIPRELRNNKAVVVYSGARGCGPADPRDRCAGPAARGDYFLAVERTTTPERGLLQQGVTCGSCKCCLECRDPAARKSVGSACMGMTLPDTRMCSATVPQECQAVCSACDQCPDAPQGTLGTGLNMCEERSGRKRCAGCDAYNRCLEQKIAENRSCPGNYPKCPQAPQTPSDCRACLLAECDTDQLRPPCYACRDAEEAQMRYPMEPARWQPHKMRCEMQGANGCYGTPVAVLRSGLTDDEQSLESPEVDLAGETGDIVLELAYVPFNVGRTYTQVVQGVPASQWLKDQPQEVRVQLCASDCAKTESWSDAKFVNGENARLPAEVEYENGLSFGEQSKTDWSLNVKQIPIPDSFRTSTFRFRLLPRLEDDARIGVDRVVIRRRS